MKGSSGCGRGASILAAVVFILGGICLANPPDRVRVFPLEQQVTMEPAGSIELAGVLGGNVALAGPLHTLPANAGIVVREIPSVWRARVPIGIDVDDLDVRVELVSNTGLPAALTGPGADSDVVFGQVRALPPRVVRMNPRWTFIEGGVVVELDASEITLAGTYGGHLVVHIEPHNP